jgi:hypothetical protein
MRAMMKCPGRAARATSGAFTSQRKVVGPNCFLRVMRNTTPPWKEHSSKLTKEESFYPELVRRRCPCKMMLAGTGIEVVIDPFPFQGAPVADPRDIACTKISAVARRAAPNASEPAVSGTGLSPGVRVRQRGCARWLVVDHGWRPGEQARRHRAGCDLVFVFFRPALRAATRWPVRSRIIPAPLPPNPRAAVVFQDAEQAPMPDMPIRPGWEELKKFFRREVLRGV